MNPLDAHDIVTTLGTIGVLAALFIETGLLVGLFLPGDSLLFVAGLAASGTAREIFGDQLSYAQLMIWAPIFATAGSQFGHWLGAKFGRPFFDRPNFAPNQCPNCEPAVANMGAQIINWV